MRIVICVGFLIVFQPTTNALTLVVEGASPGSLPIFDVTAGSTPLEIEIAILNETDSTSLPVLIWQIALGTTPEMDATGDFQFTAIGAPPNPLFGVESNPQTLDPIPAASPVAYEVDPNFEGVSIPSSSTISIVTLSLMPAEGTNGTFTMYAVPFDSDDLDHTSFWVTPDEEFMEFANPVGGSQLIELATINVTGPEISPIGDYNNDLFVDSADYTVWRDGLDNEFMPEHYSVWKEHFGEQVGQNATAYLVPESSVLQILAVLSCWLGSSRVVTRWSLPRSRY